MTASLKEYWDKRLQDSWGPHGVGSLAYGRRYNEWLYRVRRRALLGVCRRLDTDIHRARVLDVGCGTGFYVDQWKSLGARSITGVDFSSFAITRLREQYPGLEFHEADIGGDPSCITGGNYDVISAFDVLFHLVDDDRYVNALRNIHGLLRPGGYLLYSDNFLRGPSKQYLDYWKTRSRREAEAALDEAGFDIIDCVPVFVLMNSPVDAQSRLFPRLWDLGMKFVRRSEAVGFLFGAALYPFELLCRKFVRPGPSTKIMVCRRRM